MSLLIKYLNCNKIMNIGFYDFYKSYILKFILNILIVTIYFKYFYIFLKTTYEGTCINSLSF